MVKASSAKSLDSKPLLIPALPAETGNPLRFKAVILYVAAATEVLELKGTPNATSLHAVIN